MDETVGVGVGPAERGHHGNPQIFRSVGPCEAGSICPTFVVATDSPGEGEGVKYVGAATAAGGTCAAGYSYGACPGYATSFEGLS